MTNANLYALFEARFLQAGDAPAFRLDDGTRISYRQLHDGVCRMANALGSLGVNPGDRVTVQVDKSIANVCLYLASLKTGAVFQPLNTAYTPAEVDFFISDAEPRIVVCDPVKAEEIGAIAAKHGQAAVLTLDAAGRGSLSEAAAGQDAVHATVHRGRDDLAALLYTSGTTGRSKGAMISHGNVSSNGLALVDLWQFRPGDVLLHLLPIFHVHGLQVALHTAFLSGLEIIWQDRFDAARAIDLLPEATIMMGVPTFYTRLLARDDLTTGITKNMRLFISGSAPLLAETHDAFAERTGHRILERYGMTETGMITSNPYDGDRVAGTVGHALPDVDVRIADDEGTEVGRGEIGVLEVRGRNVFKGYWKLPEKTAEEFRQDGYFVTGDMATMAEDGRVTLVGRAKDLIISGGFNVYPKEIELAIDEIDGVGESAVIGVPHPDFGEGVVAVIAASGAACPDEAGIISLLSRKLAKFKVPKRVFFTADLPRNAMGKVQKVQLREQHRGTFEGA